MAVTLTKTFRPEFYLSNLSGCVGGGEDYRTIGGFKTVDDGLYTYAFINDDISSACILQDIKMTFEARIRTSSNTVTSLKASMKNGLGLWSPTDKTGGWKIDYLNHEVGSSSNWSNMASQTAYPTNVSAKANYHLGVRMRIENDNLSSVRVYIRNVSFTVTRTRACYVTFKGDGITESKTVYDYGTIPSFGSTPTRSGYIFKGWNNGSTTYTGTLPTAYEQDVTYTAVWELAKTNKIYIGVSQPKEIYVGNQAVKEVYVGTTKIYG